MQLYSTKNRALKVGLKQAIFEGLPPDNGLYMPSSIPRLLPSFFEALPNMKLSEIGYHVCQNLFGNTIAESDLKSIVNNAINFPAPVVELDANKLILELFHGPSLAFKDFGARFMAQIMSYFNQGEEQDLTILVATSGDTGGAVAAGFYKTPGIRVVILYPSGKVSPLQEKQLTTLGHNITALEVNGTFDDCQALVKRAFLDKKLRNKIRISSANSINIARLIPQSFYYFDAYRQVLPTSKEVVFCVPSGNFGNLTAGLFAYKMGLPIHRFIAATNSNDIVPTYLTNGNYQPRPSIRTLSNAMDVGNPSNFARMLDLFTTTKDQNASTDNTTWRNMQGVIAGYAFTDKETKTAVRKVKSAHNYVIDPHGAVGYLALDTYQKHYPNTLGIILETAHPAKFREDMDEILGSSIDIPERLQALDSKEKKATPIEKDYIEFTQWMYKNMT